MKRKTLLIIFVSIIVLVLLVLFGAREYYSYQNKIIMSDGDISGVNLSPSGKKLKALNYNSDTTFIVSLNDELPQLNTRIQLHLDTTSEHYLLIYRLDFRRQTQDSVFQSIIDTSQTTMSTDVEFDDFNFDGFLDFVLISDIDGAGNTSRHFWIYDDVQKRFVFNEKLSDQLVGEMVYNFSAKTIETGCSVGMGGDSNIFKFINGELTLVESNREEQVVVNDSTKIKRTIEKLVDGQLKVVEETYEDR